MSVIITHINQETMLDIIRMRSNGLSAVNVARRKGLGAHAVRKYVRIFHRFGIEAFREN